MRRSSLSKEQAGRLLELRRESDPCHVYKPGPTHERFLRSTTYNRLVTGGGRSGKSTVCLIDLAMCLRGIHPYKEWRGPIVAMVFCVSRQQAAMVAQRKLFVASEIVGPDGERIPATMQPMIPAREIKEYGSIKVGFRTYYSVTLKNGSIVYFAWADDEAAGRRIQGMEAHYIYIDEAAGTPFLLKEIGKRVMSVQKPGNGWWGCITWGATGTENNEAFEAFRTRCMDPAISDHEYFQIARGENPADNPEAIARFAATLTEDEQKVHITGEQTAAKEVQIFARQWSDDRHMMAQDYQIRPQDNLWLGYDPGMEHPTGMLLVAIRPEEPLTLHHVKFWNHSRQTLEYDLRCIEQFLLGRKLTGVVYDTVAKNSSKTGTSVLSMFMTLFTTSGITPIAGFYSAQKRHEAGIKMMRHYLDPDAYSKDVPPLIRLSPSQDSGGKLLRYQLIKYSGKEATKFTGKGGVVKKEDEGPDCFRYLVMQRPAYNKDWACGNATKTLPFPDAPPVGPPPPATVFKTPYERHLSLSRARKRRGTVGARPF